MLDDHFAIEQYLIGPQQPVVAAVLMRLQTQQPLRSSHGIALPLVSQLLELLTGVLVDARAALGIRQHLPRRDLALVVRLALDLPPLLESSNNIPVLPPELVSQPPNRAVLPPRLQPQHAQRLRHYHPLLAVVRRGHALEDLQTLHGFRAALGLVRDHAADGAPEHLGWGAEMPGTTPGGIVASLFAEEGLVLQLRPEELAGDVELLAAHYNDLLAVEQLFGYGAGKTTEEVALAVDDDLRSSVSLCDLPSHCVYMVCIPRARRWTWR